MTDPNPASNDPVLERMHNLLAEWHQAADRRAVFLSCYAMMTGNMLAAIDAGEFNDPSWVKGLLDHFADYYFNALDDYILDTARTPAPWRIAFAEIQRPKLMALQHLLLGVNAHINYDLILALADVLEPEWAEMSEEQRKLRHEDHCKVNLVIAHTVDKVQDEILDRYDPLMELVDKAFGRLDEWFISQMIAEWRDEVWEKAVRWVEDPALEVREAMLNDFERRSLHYANLFLLYDLGKVLK